MLSFVWDEEKNKINVLKHGVSFQEAQTMLCLFLIPTIQTMRTGLS